MIGPRWVGDMVMAQTLFSALKQIQPEAAIDVMAPAWAGPLVSRMPEVVECHTVAGDFDFLLKIAVRDVADYKRLLWSEFEQIAEIKTLRSTILLDSPKMTAATGA